MGNRDLSVSSFQCRLTEPRVEGSVMALDKDNFLLAAFRKVQKIGKGLKSNENSNKAGFFFIKNSIHETWKRLEGLRLYERFLFTLPVSGHLLVGFLSRSSDTIISGYLRSRILCENHSDIFVI